MITGKKVFEDVAIKDVNITNVNKRKHSDTDSSDDDSSDSDYDVEEAVAPASGKPGAKAGKKEEFEVVSQDPGSFLCFCP